MRESSMASRDTIYVNGRRDREKLTQGAETVGTGGQKRSIETPKCSLYATLATMLSALLRAAT